MSTLTYVYADSIAVLGPLSTYAEPHAYDLCSPHGERLSVPRGWEVLRLSPDPLAGRPTTDDLLALADAVREAAGPAHEPGTPAQETGQQIGQETGQGTGRRGHLRVLTSE